MIEEEKKLDSYSQGWIGVIPDHWHVKCVKHIARFTTGWTPPTGHAASYIGVNPWANIGDLGPKVITETANQISDDAVKSTGIKISPVGSLLFSFKLSVGQVSIAGQSMFTNEAIATFPPQDDFDIQWAYYAFPKFIPENAAINIYGAKLLNQQRINDALLPFPPKNEQIAIAAYLDTETTRIDDLIQEKRRLITLLSEQLTHVAESVIAPAASGREAKLAFFVDLLPGYAFPSEDFSHDPSDIRLLRGVNVAPGGLRWEDVVYWPKTQASSVERFRLSTGDIVFGMDRPWISTGARVAIVDSESDGCLLLQRVCRIRGGDRTLNRFVYYALSSDRFRQSIEFELSGISVPHISPEQIKRFKVPLLSLEEQCERCDVADIEMNRLKELIQHTENTIGLLLDLRQATITDAVLGRIDTRASAAH